MTFELIDAPEPGIYYDVEPAEYFAWNAISNSSLHAAKTSMALYHMGRTVEETSSMRLGSLCHAGRFEPETLDLRYAVMPDFSAKIRRKNGESFSNPRSSNQWKALEEEFRENNVGKTIVEERDLLKMRQVVNALARNELANDYLTGGQNEVSIVCRDPQTGLLLKGRVDHLNPEKRRIADLKTTWDLSTLNRTIRDRGYRRQVALYCHMLEVLEGVVFSAALVAVGTSEPWDVIAAPFSFAAMEHGRREFQGLLQQIKTCKESGVWPGLPSPSEFGLETWEQEAPMEFTSGGKAIQL